MATWADMGRENLQAAKALLDGGHWRSAISRAYYAGYSSLTGEFRESRLTFAYGDNNPSHEQLLSLTAHNLNARRYTRTQRSQVKVMTRELQGARIIADYDPVSTIDRVAALRAVRQAAFIVTIVTEAA